MKIIQIGNHAAENLIDQVWNGPAIDLRTVNTEHACVFKKR